MGWLVLEHLSASSENNVVVFYIFGKSRYRLSVLAQSERIRQKDQSTNQRIQTLANNKKNGSLFILRILQILQILLLFGSSSRWFNRV